MTYSSPLNTQHIDERFDECTSEPYLAPYTSLVGPSGVGKSYAIQHISESTSP